MQDIQEYARDNNLELAKQIPYFEGDFFPTILEEFIEETDQEDEAKKKHKEVAEQVSVGFTYCLTNNHIFKLYLFVYLKSMISLVMIRWNCQIKQTYEKNSQK